VVADRALIARFFCIFADMITEQEKRFIEYWEANREREKKWTTQLLIGLPVGLLFAIPVVLILLSGRLWYKRADMVANSELNPLVLGVCVMVIVAFVAIFYKRHQWDRKEQQYLEFKAKDTDNQDQAAVHPQEDKA
jgi:uncharacterized membrane protein